MARIPKIVIADNPLGIDLNREVVYEDTTKIFTDLVGNIIDPLELEHVKDDIRFIDAKEAVVNTINNTIVSNVIPKDLKTFDKLRFKEGDSYKVCYYNGFNKTAEITIKNRSYLKLSLKSDSGVDLTLNTFGIDFKNNAWVFGTDLYIYGNGTIRSNFNNQDGLTIQFNRDTIGNCYQFEVIKIK